MAQATVAKTSKEMLEDAKLTKAAKRQLLSVLNGEARYTEIWYGTEQAMKKAHGQLGEIFPKEKFAIRTKTAEDKDGRTYYVIAVTARISSAEVPKIRKGQPGSIVAAQALEVDKNSTQYKALESKFGGEISTQVIYWTNKYGVDPLLLAALIVAEHSGINDKNALNIVGKNLRKNINYYNKSVSNIGDEVKESRGLMQFTKPTYQTVTNLLKRDNEKVAKSYDEMVNDPAFSIKYAARYIAYIQTFLGTKDIDILAAAYNAGLQRVKNKPYKDGDIRNLARDYRQKMRNAYNELSSLCGPSSP